MHILFLVRCQLAMGYMLKSEQKTCFYKAYSTKELFAHVGKGEDKNPHRKPQQQARLPDARVPDEEQLEEVVTA